MSIDRRDERTLVQKTIQYGLVTVLWLVTVGLGVLVFIAVNDTVVMIGAPLLATEETGQVEARGIEATLQNIGAILGGLLLLTIAVGGVEYHFRRVGQRRSWQVLAWTIGLELLIVAGWLLLTA